MIEKLAHRSKHPNKPRIFDPNVIGDIFEVEHKLWKGPPIVLLPLSDPARRLLYSFSLII